MTRVWRSTVEAGSPISAVAISVDFHHFALGLIFVPRFRLLGYSSWTPYPYVGCYTISC